MGGVFNPEPGHASRDRLSRIGHHFLSEDRRHLHMTLFPRHDDPHPLRAIDLARALARLGTRVAVIEPEHGTLLSFRPLPEPDTVSVTAMRSELRGGQTRQTNYADKSCGIEVTIIESTTTAHAMTAPFILIATPADAAGMRHAWLDLKALADGMTPPPVGVTITGANSLDEAAYCYGKFAAAAERFLGLELVSYACLLRDRQNHERELRNIATLLIADYQSGADAALSDDPPEEQR